MFKAFVLVLYTVHFVLVTNLIIISDSYSCTIKYCSFYTMTLYGAAFHEWVYFLLIITK